jgi:hypothetical protein
MDPSGIWIFFAYFLWLFFYARDTAMPHTDEIDLTALWSRHRSNMVSIT